MLVVYRYRKPTTENLVKHGSLSPQDMSLTENISQVVLLGGMQQTRKIAIHLNLAPNQKQIKQF